MSTGHRFFFKNIYFPLFAKNKNLINVFFSTCFPFLRKLYHNPLDIENLKKIKDENYNKKIKVIPSIIVRKLKIKIIQQSIYIIFN